MFAERNANFCSQRIFAKVVFTLKADIAKDHSGWRPFQSDIWFNQVRLPKDKRTQHEREQY